jgi:putative colanic acid biosysnthesis UDP-glucose lipid carrier transferase
MKREGRVIEPRGISVVSRVTDAIVVFAAYALVHRIHGGPLTDVHLAAASIAVLVFHFVAEAMGLYRGYRGVSLRSDVSKILGAWVTVIFALLLAAFLAKKSDELSRLSTSAWFVITPVGLIGLRVASRTALGVLRRSGKNCRPTAILGATSLGRTLIDEIQRAPWLGLRVAGVFDDRSRERCDAACLEAVTHHGSLEDLVRAAREGSIGLVYIALPLRAEPRVLEMVEALSDTTASVYFATDFETFDLLHARWTSVGGTPAVSIHETPFYGVDGWLKRLEDLVLGCMILCLIAVPMALIGLLVKLTSKGPVFFRQRRYGLNGEVIDVLKFRTMVVAEDGPIVQQATKDDPRITPLGRFLRRTSLDELPQFIHVITGTMSIVGPRPHAVAHNEAYRRQIRRYMLRHKVKPGITGWAQVNGWRGETDTLEKMQKRIEHDLEYIRHWDLLWDLQIILRTIFGRSARKNAY